MAEISDAELDRFARQILVAAIGYDGQARLLAARVTLTGEPEAVDLTRRYLAAAGVSIVATSGGPVGELIVRRGRREWRRSFEPGDPFAMMTAVGYLGVQVLVDLAQEAETGET